MNKQITLKKQGFLPSNEKKFLRFLNLNNEENESAGQEEFESDKERKINMESALSKQEKNIDATLNQKLKENMGLLARYFKKTLRRIEKVQGRGQNYQQKNDSNQDWRCDKERSGNKNSRRMHTNLGRDVTFSVMSAKELDTSDLNAPLLSANNLNAMSEGVMETPR